MMALLTLDEARALKRNAEATEITSADIKAMRKELTKKLGRKPTKEDWIKHWQEGFNQYASSKQRRDLSTANQKLGKEAGRKWAESGQSIDAVEAIYNHRVNGDTTFEQMCEAVGDDEEFAALDEKDDDYQYGWEQGVAEIYKEWNK